MDFTGNGAILEDKNNVESKTLRGMNSRTVDLRGSRDFELALVEDLLGSQLKMIEDCWITGVK